MNAGLANDSIGHIVGLSASIYANGKFKSANFRDGIYYYDKGGIDAITIGNVITGPRSLYNSQLTSLFRKGYTYGDLDQHERKHYFEQSSLNKYYLPIHGLAIGSRELFGKPYLDCKPFSTTTYSDIGIRGC